MKHKHRTHDEFINECNEIHNYRYDYGKTKFTALLKQITVTCKEHGDFYPYANNHLKGSGCKKCAQYDTIYTFIAKARKIHGYTYSYDAVVYNGSKNYIDIKCKKHGMFAQKPNDHLSGSGCPMCKPNYKSNTDEFILKASQLYENIYDYSRVVYKKSDCKVDIICKEHGLFQQTPNNHLNGHGCPVCSNFGFSKEKDGYFYIQKITKQSGDVYYKFGITNRTVECRLNEQQRKSKAKHEVIYKLFSSGIFCI